MLSDGLGAPLHADAPLVDAEVAAEFEAGLHNQASGPQIPVNEVLLADPGIPFIGIIQKRLNSIRVPALLEGQPVLFNEVECLHERELQMVVGFLPVAALDEAGEALLDDDRVFEELARDIGKLLLDGLHVEVWLVQRIELCWGHRGLYCALDIRRNLGLFINIRC